MPSVSLTRGRPSLYNPRGQAFARLYLDPLNRAEDICLALGISRATLHNYEKELGLPTLRVGVGRACGLPAAQAMKIFCHPIEKYELALLRELGRSMGVRLKLVPMDVEFERTSALRKRRVDFYIGASVRTPQAAEEFYHSTGYHPYSQPHGRVVFVKGWNEKGFCQKPVLAVKRNSIHHRYAACRFGHNFEIKPLRNYDLVNEALEKKNVAAAFLHPLLLGKSRALLTQVMFDPKIYVLEGYTAMVFHSDSADWIPSVNRSLDELHERGLLKSAYETAYEINEEPPSRP